MAKRGRPSSYTDAIAAEICERLAEGESLRKICSADGFPEISTIRRWLIQNENFRSQYARARQEQADYYVDEIVAIADGCEEKADSIQKARLKIDTLKWIASKLKPKAYGEKLDVEHSGGITVQITDRESKL